MVIQTGGHTPPVEPHFTGLSAAFFLNRATHTPARRKPRRCRIIYIVPNSLLLLMQVKLPEFYGRPEPASATVPGSVYLPATHNDIVPVWVEEPTLLWNHIGDWDVLFQLADSIAPVGPFIPLATPCRCSHSFFSFLA
jgi:hypothetical protein